MIKEKVEKSVDLIEREQQAYHDLVRFIRWLANAYAVPGNWLMNQDDLTAEGFFMLAKVLPKYIDRPYTEFLAIARTSIKNWFGTLKFRALCTHRKQDLLNYSLNSEAEFDNELNLNPSKGAKYIFSDGINNHVQSAFSDNLFVEALDPQLVLEQMDDLAAKISKLCEFDQRILSAIQGGNDRVALYIDLQRKRRNWVFDNPTISVSKLVVARALCIEVEQVREAYERISSVFAN